MADPVPTLKSLTSEQRQRVEELSTRFRNSIQANPNVLMPDFLTETSGVERQVLRRELLRVEIEDRIIAHELTLRRSCMVCRPIVR